MIRVEFITAQGERVSTEAPENSSLLEAGQACGMPLEGTCEGQMACSTCHVIIADEWFSKLLPASDDEEDMLDLAAGVVRNSRLSCQILLTSALAGIIVHIPKESHDMQLL